MTNAPLLLYDGQCGFCNGIVKLVLRHDRRGTLRFAWLQGVHGDAVRARYPSLEGVDSVVWVEGDGAEERVLVRSAAALRLASYLGGAWRLALVGRVVPRILRDALYDMVARLRYRLAGRSESCELPSPSTRQRFLD